MPTVAVVGAGLVGCLAALGLSKKGFEVSVYELRGDPRGSTDKNLRSINLAVSARGINALGYVDVGLAEKVMSKVVPMYGRMIHSNGVEESQKYDINGQALNSIDREYLNTMLLEEAEKSGIRFHFKHKLIKLEMKGKEFGPVLFFQGFETPVTVDLVVGADGAFSRLRQELQKYVRMDYTQEYIDCAYLELSIAPNNSKNFDERFKLDKNHIHIWPRHEHMLIALPNLDGSFTSTFFSPWSLIESLDSDEKVRLFFEENFPDAIDLITQEKLLYAFKNHPKGKLLSITCSTYHYQDKAVIIGDAAHAMVPFYGQGMNCGFEDVYILLSTIDRLGGDLGAALDDYSKNRHDDLVTITHLAIDNYKEMAHSVTSKLFLARQKIDLLLTYLLKNRWMPLHSMISFRSDINYSTALLASKRQDRIINYLEVGFFGAAALGLFKVWHALKRG